MENSTDQTIAVPVTRYMFRQQLQSFFIIQLWAVTLPLGLQWHGHIANRMDYQIFGLVLLLISQCYMTFYFYKNIGFEGRLRDIYPQETNLKLKYFPALYLLPVTMLSLIAFLVFKERVEAGPAPKIFKQNRWPLLIFFSCLGVHVISTMMPLTSHRMLQARYWTAEPSIYYVSTVAYEATTILAMKDELKAGMKVTDLFKQHEISRNPSLTAGVLMMSVVATKAMEKKEQQRSLASDSNNDKTNFEFSISMLEELTEVVKLTDQALPTMFKFNPFLLASPPSLIEAAMLGGMDMKMRLHLHSVLMENMMTLSNSIGSSLTKDEKGEFKDFVPRLEKVKKDMNETNSNIAYEKFKTSWLALL